ncbi:PHA/PHB synthase family protein [Parvibium lacunae]|uniref:Class I poly(R)-hydroxyalkanoic acid synthase n=1 Tax=Parvibium lacunae TaxID=1888893 RepID=A0A368L737_9BURK|nr:class I poly(R)-hydroxyalkanoic acid synthase [Parvibium lacunae]RCS59463.1 class I poly(R)-hydroxyalkanoic acid synthase [Parvibium lacunae]
MQAAWQQWWQQWSASTAGGALPNPHAALNQAGLQQWAGWWGKQLAEHWPHLSTQIPGQSSPNSAVSAVQQSFPAALWAQYAVHLDPQAQLRLQQEYSQEMTELWSAWQAQQEADGLSDRRFAAQAWHDHGMNELNAMVYLLNAKYLLKLADQVEGDIKTKNKIRFALQQWIDAVAPSNFLVTNPEAQQRIIETKGESLRVGMENMLDDLRKGRISQTDESAFEVGKNVATTPGQVVFQNPLFQLIQYRAQTPEVGARPLLIVPPCINKYYILDLQPDNSLVNYCVQQGHTVFLVSWANAMPEHAGLTWDDYVADGVIEAIHTVQQISRQETINVLGFCVGGTLLATALSTMAARGDHAVASLTLLTTMLDFTDVGALDVYIDEAQVALREQTIGNGGLLPGRDLASAFSSLRPNDLIWNYVVNNYLKGQRPPAFDLLYWNSDSTNLPGPMFCWYLRNTYLENKLREPGKARVCGEPVDFSRIQVPTYVLAAREDHIVPWQSAYLSAQLLGAARKERVRFALAASGHIAGVINPASKNKRSYWLMEQPSQKNAESSLPESSSDWLNHATEHPGSWWRDWQNWLTAYRGPEVTSPTQLGSRKFMPLEAAPGTYVKVRA